MAYQRSLTIIITAAFSTSLLTATSCAKEEVCDWEDNDKDGIIDEGFDADSDGVWACGITQVLYESGEFDCNDNDPSINPFVLELCNGEDTNCDGIVDDGCAQFALESSAPIEYLFVTDIDLDNQPDLTVFSGGAHYSDWEISVLPLDSTHEKLYSSEIDWSPAVIQDSRPSTIKNGFLLGYGDGLAPFSISFDESVLLDLENLYEIWPEELILPLKMTSCANDGSLLSLSYSYDENNFLLQTLVPNGESFNQIDQYRFTTAFDGTLFAFPVDLDLDGLHEIIIADSHSIFVVQISQNHTISIQNNWHFEESIGQLTFANGSLGLFPNIYFTIPETWQLLEIQNQAGVLDQEPTERGLLRNPLGVTGIDFDSDNDIDLVISDGNAQTITLLESDEGILKDIGCVYSTGGRPSRLQTLNLPDSAPVLAIIDDENYTLLLIDDLCSDEELNGNMLQDGESPL